ncbi:hypothetical protein IQ07DRAFT_386004 [Pyrenochaeta sp. DS3sAY3a]|nr:hypothetical protein IQ07DRAFT_386004 [Pyrenochaeta sp. DS3sAY3a]
MAPPPPKTTIWLWSFGLFPRRILYYLRAKNISLSVLATHNIHLVPVLLAGSSLISAPGHEARPPNTSLPCMRVEHGDGSTLWVHESAAVMEYLEEVFGVADAYPDLRGASIQQRAKARDIVSLLTDALFWGTLHMTNALPVTLAWSGLQAHEMHADTAAHALRKHGAVLDRLEEWARGDVLGKGSMSIAGDGTGTTVADVVLLAQVEYLKAMYGVDWCEGREVLGVWWERTMGQEWVIGNEELGGVEGTGDWEGILGK